MIRSIEPVCRTRIAAWQRASAARRGLPKDAPRERTTSTGHAGTVLPERAVGSTERAAALTVARRLRVLAGWPRIMVEAREAADGSTSAVTHRLPPAATQLQMAGRRAFAAMAARASTALRAASRLPVTQRHAPTAVTPARIRVAASAPRAHREAAVSAVEARGRSRVAGSAAVTRPEVVAAVTRPAVAEATAAATDRNVISERSGGGTETNPWRPLCFIWRGFPIGGRPGIFCCGRTRSAKRKTLSVNIGKYFRAQAGRSSLDCSEGAR
jgi:hypothetical protein